MGCDIHMYVQYREKERAGTQYDWWSSFGGRINPGRNYSLFGVLCDGVRSEAPEGKCYEQRGLPEKLGYAADYDVHLHIRDDDEPREENTCTLEDAKRWGRRIEYDKDGKPWRTSHPDWHSHSWLTTKELAQAYRWYNSINRGYGVGAEYKALLAAMKALENKGKNEVIVVFWFDN